MKTIFFLVAFSFTSGLFSADSTTGATNEKVARTECENCRTNISVNLSSIAETPWIEPHARKSAWKTNYSLTNQSGNTLKLFDVLNKPTAIAFLYTRCENPNKCPLTASTMAKLQKDLIDQNLFHQIRLCLLTYDPEHDSADILTQYAVKFGIACSDSMMMLRPNPDDKKQLFEEMNISVNFNKKDVSIHGLQLIILDGKGRFVRNYHSLIWNNGKVIEDLKRLIIENK